MSNDKFIADVGSFLLMLFGWALDYVQVGVGIFMLVGGAILMVYRLSIARKENKIATLELKKLEKEVE